MKHHKSLEIFHQDENENTESVVNVYVVDHIFPFYLKKEYLNDSGHCAENILLTKV